MKIRFHEPVMAEEVLEFLSRSTPAIVVDCTVGDGGHTKKILDALTTHVIGMDVDEEALERSQKRLMPRYFGRLNLVKGDYRELPAVLGRLGAPWIDGALFDLGISSLQVDSKERGFTYKEGAPLDMRMDLGGKRNAKDILMSWDEDKLEKILREYGEERFSTGIAKGIVNWREAGNSFSTADDLVKVVLAASGRRGKRSRAHPARRTFQAIRIATNDELSRLGDSLRKAFNLLREGGVISVLTYHSLEDRIVKRTFADIEAEKTGRRLNKKVIRPAKEEIKRNPRAQSAKLRAIVKTA